MYDSIGSICYCHRVRLLELLLAIVALTRLSASGNRWQISGSTSRLRRTRLETWYGIECHVHLGVSHAQPYALAGRSRIDHPPLALQAPPNHPWRQQRPQHHLLASRRSP
jgi:hypothetical protein